MLCLGRNCPGLKEMIVRSLPYLPGCVLTASPGLERCSKAGQAERNKATPFPNTQDKGMRGAKRAVIPQIPVITRAEAGSTAQNFTVKLIRYVLEGISDGGFKLYKGTNSYPFWS